MCRALGMQSKDYLNYDKYNKHRIKRNILETIQDKLLKDNEWQIMDSDLLRNCAYWAVEGCEGDVVSLSKFLALSRMTTRGLPIYSMEFKV